MEMYVMLTCGGFFVGKFTSRALLRYKAHLVSSFKWFWATALVSERHQAAPRRPPTTLKPHSVTRYLLPMGATPPSGLLNRITLHPEVCHGKPTVRELRCTVESLLEYLSAGNTFEDILAEFPDLEREDLQACIQFATESLKLKSWRLVAA
jgi:uncharacterized protein (DUF433 family)